MRWFRPGRHGSPGPVAVGPRGRRRAVAPPIVMTVVISLVAGCRPPAPPTHTSPEAAAAHAQHVARLDTLATRLDALRRLAADPSAGAGAIRGAFTEARASYKRLEAILELETPTTAEQLNGPPLPEVEEDEAAPREKAPDGFQVVEALLWPDVTSDRAALDLELRRMAALVVRARQVTAVTLFSDVGVWDAARQELARVATLGIAGFDSPLARLERPEIVHALTGLRATLAPWARRGGLEVARADSALAATAAALDTAGDPDATDRLGWLTRHALPAARRLAAARVAAGVALPTDRRPWRAESATPYDAGAFDAAAYALRPDAPDTPALAALGASLFADPGLSGDGSRACASCHVPSLAFTDGRPRSLPLRASRAVLRNSPTLINSALQAAQFADARARSPEDQVFDVVSNRDEMHGSLEAVAARLRSDDGWRDRFAAAGVAAEAITPAILRHALAAYLRGLVALDAPFDRHVRGDTAAMSAAERRGANVFLGKGKCATCHFLPLTSGTVPPMFTEHETEVLGVPATARWHGARVDPDAGRARISGRALHLHAFKTPSVRNAALTAPYMHNGVYRTLDEVIRFYDVGGGAGIGARLGHQTLPADSLRLTRDERRDLIAFLGALTDTAGTRRPH